MTPKLCFEDAAYESDAIRSELILRGTTYITPYSPTRKRTHAFDRKGYRMRNTIEHAVSQLKDFRRAEIRYGKLAWKYPSALQLINAIYY
jgi:hypothetical protein